MSHLLLPAPNHIPYTELGPPEPEGNGMMNEKARATETSLKNEPIHRLNVGGEKLALPDMGPIIVVREHGKLDYNSGHYDDRFLDIAQNKDGTTRRISNW